MIYFKLFWCNLCFILWGKKSSVTELVTARLPMKYFEIIKKKKKKESLYEVPFANLLACDWSVLAVLVAVCLALQSE